MRYLFLLITLLATFNVQGQINKSALNKWEKQSLITAFRLMQDYERTIQQNDIATAESYEKVRSTVTYLLGQTPDSTVWKINNTTFFRMTLPSYTIAMNQALAAYHTKQKDYKNAKWHLLAAEHILEEGTLFNLQQILNYRSVIDSIWLVNNEEQGYLKKAIKDGIKQAFYYDKLHKWCYDGYIEQYVAFLKRHGLNQRLKNDIDAALEKLVIEKEKDGWHYYIKLYGEQITVLDDSALQEANIQHQDDPITYIKENSIYQFL